MYYQFGYNRAEDIGINSTNQIILDVIQCIECLNTYRYQKLELQVGSELEYILYL